MPSGAEGAEEIAASTGSSEDSAAWNPSVSCCFPDFAACIFPTVSANDSPSTVSSCTVAKSRSFGTPSRSPWPPGWIAMALTSPSESASSIPSGSLFTKTCRVTASIFAPVSAPSGSVTHCICFGID